jgi:hypothetical protein
MDSAEHSPARIIPQRGQVSENTSKPSSSESWGVFHEYEAWSHLANDSGHFRPQSAPFSIQSLAGAGNTDVLAREAARDDIHKSSPRSPVEGSHIVPDGEWLKASVVLAGHEDSPGVLVAFDGTDRPPSEQLAAENAASSACEKCQLIQQPPPSTGVSS